VLLSVMVVISSVVCLAGKLGDVWGQAALFSVGFLLFTVGSLLGGFSQSSQQGHDLLGYRVVIGLGASFLFTNSSAILTDAFAPFGQVGCERPRRAKPSGVFRRGVQAARSTCFVHYRRPPFHVQVGLAQGVFAVFSSLGTVLGPLIGGSLADTDW
jgi:MFS family permease